MLETSVRTSNKQTPIQTINFMLFVICILVPKSMFIVLRKNGTALFDNNTILIHKYQFRIEVLLPLFVAT